MRVKATATFDSSGLVRKIHRIATDDSVGIAGATSLAKRMEQYVPRYTGRLRASAVISPWTVTYTAPYAIYPYFGRNVSHWTTPGTNSHWDKYVNKGEVANDITQAIKRIL